jgi:glycosyltransferase involved in cell wall biosynthesis
MYCLPDDVIRKRGWTTRSHARLEAAFENVVRAARLVVAGSNYLREQAMARGARKVVVIRTGVAVPPRRLKSGSNFRECVVVWTGSTPTLPFLELMRPALLRFMRSRASTLRIICDRFPSWLGQRCERVRWAPDIGLRDLVSATVGVAPLPDTPYARGKCAYKIAQYMAAGLPVLASPVGANSELFELGCQGVLAAETVSQVRALEVLYEDKSLCARWGNENRECAAEHLDIRVLGSKLVEVLREAAE